MNDQAYIEIAAKAANGWLWNQPLGYLNTSWSRVFILDEIPRYVLDVLAAQLRRQVRAAGYFVNISGTGAVKIIEFTMTGAPLEREHTIAEAFADDEAMNTIKAVVDSKALDK